MEIFHEKITFLFFFAVSSLHTRLVYATDIAYLTWYAHNFQIPHYGRQTPTKEEIHRLLAIFVIAETVYYI